MELTNQIRCELSVFLHILAPPALLSLSAGGALAPPAPPYFAPGVYLGARQAPIGAILASAEDPGCLKCNSI